MMRTGLCVAAAAAVALLFACLPETAHALDLIIESRKAGNSSGEFKGIRGKWLASQRKSSAPGLMGESGSGSRKVILGSLQRQTTRSLRSLSSAPAAARFLPNLTTRQRLHVYITWPAGANVQPVTITVRHAEGEEKMAYAQRGYGTGEKNNANRWIPLGEFDFLPGEDQYVEMRVDPGFSTVYPGRQIDFVADAVRFTTEQLASQQLAPGPSKTGRDSAQNRKNKFPREAQGSGADADEGNEVRAEADDAPVDDTVAEVAVIPFSAPPLHGTPIVTEIYEPVTGGAATPGQVVWHSTIDAARAAARDSRRRLLLFFFDQDSPETQDLENALAGPEPSTLIVRDYEPVKIRFTEETKLAERLGVTRPGWILLFDGDGRALGSITSVGDSAELAEQLRRL